MAESDAVHGRQPRGDGGAVGHAAPAPLHHEHVGLGGDDLVLDAVLEARHGGEHHDERAHPEEDAADPDPDEEGEAATAGRARGGT